MDIQFQWVGGATFILSAGDLKIACDPVLCKKGTMQDYFWFTSERLEEPVYDENTFRDIDLWLITHDHEDHLDSPGLSVISPDSRVVSNRNASKLLRKQGIRDLTELSWNQRITYAVKGYQIEIVSVPAIHGVNPLSAFFAGRGNGYYITLSNDQGKVSIYITGDTVYKRRTIHSLDGKKIDLMVPNMGAAKAGSWIMTLTLNSDMLLKMMGKLNPTRVIPVHYGTFEHYIEPVGKIKALHDDRIYFISVGNTITFSRIDLIT